MLRDPPSAQISHNTFGPSSYVGAHTLLAHDAVAEPAIETSVLSRTAPQIEPLLQCVEATILPKPPLLAALTEAYFANVFDRYPVTDRREFDDPTCSVLLKQAVCMAGSLTRHSSRGDGLALSRRLYEKTKLMLSLNYDPNPVTVLAALCLMICWSPNPTDLLSLDCPWQWTGTAIRMALQMGLHKESTYLKHSQPGRLRRLWWILMNADRLQAACFGRPLAVRYSDCDTRLPNVADFENPDSASSVFIQYAGLTSIWGEIADIGISGRSASTADLQRLTDSVYTWIAALPEEVRLFTATGLRRPYRQSVSELHMVYFVTIILLEAVRLQNHHRWSSSVPSIIAASSVARLIEEVDCWEDLNLMSSSTTFYMMAASIPLIYHRPNQAGKIMVRNEELQILCSTLDRLESKWGGAPVVRKNIEKIRNMVEWQTLEHQSENQEPSTIGAAGASTLLPRLAEIFPFPQSLCSNMDLVNDNVERQLDSETFLPSFEEDNLPWLGPETQSYLDFFRLDSYDDPPIVDSETFALIDN
ncbi:hypothetical protein LTR84_007132 [Exophiala bonariae]|uniref:Xylanolytic transcriptional activator regulatory domain-containing protein n=1 Tax=Exophiala bonariae TaxID=1690606 RepID=A0AAV9N1S3_9EURO|nr:hypothetical protein LTR84_007132 [Exophiala bonariae]